MVRLAKVVAGLLVVCVLALPRGALVEPPAAKANPVVQAGLAVGQFALLKLANYAANNLKDNNLFGTFLRYVGFGDAGTPQLDYIQKTVDEINVKVDKLQVSVDKLAVRVEHTNCNVSRTSLSGNEAEIETAWTRIRDTVVLVRNKPADEQKKLGANLPAAINNVFKGSTPAATVTKIHNVLIGTKGTLSMIHECGVAYQANEGRFVSSSLHDEVESLVHYWQGLEAEAAVMDIGLLASEGNEALARIHFAQAESNLKEEAARVKPSLHDLVLDTHTRRFWGKDFHVTTYDTRNTIPDLKFGRLPSYAEAADLFKACCAGLKVIDWLRRDTPFVVPNRQPPPPVTHALVSNDMYKRDGKFVFSTRDAVDLTGDKARSTGVKDNVHAYMGIIVNTSGPDRYLYRPLN